MSNQVTIRKVLAFVMLLVFSFSITPKSYWHDLLADHTDNYAFSSAIGSTINKTGFDCDTEDLVVPTPFIESSAELIIDRKAGLQEFLPATYHFHFHSFHTTRNLRGPPSVA